MKFDVKANFQVILDGKLKDIPKGTFETSDKELIEKLKNSKYATEQKAVEEKVEQDPKPEPEVKPEDKAPAQKAAAK